MVISINSYNTLFQYLQLLEFKCFLGCVTLWDGAWCLGGELRDMALRSASISLSSNWKVNVVVRGFLLFSGAGAGSFARLLNIRFIGGFTCGDKLCFLVLHCSLCSHNCCVNSVMQHHNYFIMKINKCYKLILFL